MFAGPSFAQLLFSTDTLQFARQFARDALFQHLYRPTVGLVNHQWTNLQIVVKLFSCHGKDWQSPWNGSLIMKLCYTWNQEIAAKYIKYIKWYCITRYCNSTALALSPTWSKQRFPTNLSQGFPRWPQMFTAQLQPAWEGKTSFTVNFRERYPYRSKLSSITSSVVKRQRRVWGELSFLLQ